MLLGIDVGGTFTDAVVINDGQIICHAKTPTTQENLLAGILKALDKVLLGIKCEQIERVSLSTTIVTNALLNKDIDRVALLTIPGPGMDAKPMLAAEPVELAGYIDHRGREIVGVGELEDKLKFEDYDVFAVSGKFSVRNPRSEQQVKKWLIQKFTPKHISLGSEVSGKLNFVRRTNAAYFNAAVWRKFGEFIAAVGESLSQRKITAPVYVLKADGGTLPLDVAQKVPIEAIFTGPAASVLGILAMNKPVGQAVSLDIGGTTTDIALWWDGKPLFSEKGAKIEGYNTSVRAFILRSVGIGGDSWVRRENGKLFVGPIRKGPAMALGGPVPTLSDAMIVLGDMAFGSSEKAYLAIQSLTDNKSVKETAREILEMAATVILSEIASMLEEQAAQPVYTVNDIINTRKLKPEKIIGVGGAAVGIVPWVAKGMGIDYSLPTGGMVANAVGAALARPTLDITLRADTVQGYYTIPELGIQEKLPQRRFSGDDARRLCSEYLAGEAKRLAIQFSEVESMYEEEFNVVRGFNTTGKIYTCRMQLKPGVLMSVSGKEVSMC